MKVMTSRFGEIEVPDDSTITFPQGVVGFKECTRFIIFDCGEEGIFKWLQSVDNPEIAFVICEASLIVPNYQVVVGQQELETLQLDNIEDAVACLILCIPKDPNEVTANLLGPVVFNSEKRLGMQVVLVNPDYSTRHRVFMSGSEQKTDKVSAAKEG
ncbi:MAG: flagellar assembly protein FliW [Planctomycetes bacterium]|nr:flagellar assembly protein FliW [Planctomycetota bacterium]